MWRRKKLDKYFGMCKICYNLSRIEYNLRNQNNRKIYVIRHRARRTPEHIDHDIEYQRDYQRKYRSKNKHKIRDYNKKYYIKQKIKQKNTTPSDKIMEEANALLQKLTGNKNLCIFEGFDKNISLRNYHK